MNDQIANDWELLKAAAEKGWDDPGYTEPLDRTVQRAREYLESFHAIDAAKAGE